jgi:predicted AAA+ superfamily ATPase
MEGVMYIHRLIEQEIKTTLDRGKSILLLGARQTGKTTLIERLGSDLNISFLLPSVRLRYEKKPDLLVSEINELNERQPQKNLLVILDEVQKVPAMLDVVQYCIDKKIARFVVTGSSSRKLKRSSNANLLPGRVVGFNMCPFTLKEYENKKLEDLLVYGSLPGIVTQERSDHKEADLQTYVETYLEEEIRAEAWLRNVGQFARFLELVGLESGNIVSFRALSSQLGISHTTVSSYYEILEDCMIAERIDPISQSTTRKKLTKSSKYIMFDLGVRRICSNEGPKLSNVRYGQLFEQYVGLELIRYAHIYKNKFEVKFWRDPNGPEVDWVLADKNGNYTPIEVKWSDAPSTKDAVHIKTFLNEYKNSKQGFIVCQTPRAYKIDENIKAIPWQNLHDLILESL